MPVTRLSRIARLACALQRWAIVLAGQVHDRVAARQRLRRGRLARQAPSERLDASQPLRRARCCARAGSRLTAR